MTIPSWRDLSICLSVFSVLLFQLTDQVSADDPAPSDRRHISGVYPHLTVYGIYSQQGAHLLPGHDESGIGAVVPWANQLWMVTYAPHRPHGSEHKLYSIDNDLNLMIHPESVGGTPAGRMIHAESNQLFIAHYAIDEKGTVRVIPIEKMPIRVTGITRHLTDPSNLIYYFDMEGSIWEVNVHTLEPKLLFKKPVPGWHGKGAYVSQGRLVISNNGERAAGNYDDLLVGGPPATTEDRGVLAEYDGNQWRVIERRQYTEVSGPSGLAGGSDADEPIWAIGWDRRSLRLKVLEDGVWSTFLLPKAAFCNDASHGWYTEWPRIRQISKDRWLMDMHGMFYDFPVGFRTSNSHGIRPLGSHLRYIPDFCEWNGRLVLASDETSIQGNPLAGQPQSNLWFGDVSDLANWGPASAYGGPWIQDHVDAGVPSDPFLIAGFARRMIHASVHDASPSKEEVSHEAKPTVQFDVQIDIDGEGIWSHHSTMSVAAGEYVSHPLPKDMNGTWIRFVPKSNSIATIVLHQTSDEFHKPEEAVELFQGLTDIRTANEQILEKRGGLGEPTLLYAAKHNRNLVVIDSNGRQSELGKENFQFSPMEADVVLKGLIAIDKDEYSVDSASVILHQGELRWRLPKSTEAFDAWQGRGSREVQSERHLANYHGTFYEIPLLENGQPPVFAQMRPVASHKFAISDFCSWNGLLILATPKSDTHSTTTSASDHIFKSEEGPIQLWAGGIDDLWKLGKPVGVGGPWHQTSVRANEPSDPYLMTGYDKKTLTITSDVDTQITAEIDIDHQSGWHVYATWRVQAGIPHHYTFPDGFSAHWVRLRSSHEGVATAKFHYE